MNKLLSNKLYILSGPPGSGKSTFLEKNGIDSLHIVSMDKIRKDLFGSRFVSRDGEIIEEIPQEGNQEVGSIAKAIIKAKLKQKLTVFIDGTNSTDSLRSNWIRLAKEFGVESQVLLFDPSVCRENNKLKAHPVNDNVLDEFISKYQYNSKYDHIKIDTSEQYTLVPSNIIESDTELIIVGDVHGLYDEFEQFLIEQGFAIENNIIVDKRGKRKLLFMGDFVDRGTKSIEILRLIKNSVNAGHFAILGNHEEKLINNYLEFEKQNHVRLFKRRSLAVSQTFMDFIELPKVEQNELINFLINLPHYYIYKDYVMVHANIECFDPFTLTKSEAIYGHKHDDTDLNYSKLVDEGVNKYKLIRAHIMPNHEDDNVQVIFDNGEYGGNIVMFDIKNNSKLKFQTNYNYHEKVASKKALNNVINKLSNDGLIMEKQSDDGLYKIVKYSNKTFWKDLWTQDKHLLEFRGFIVDAGMNIITYPFTKLFEEDFVSGSIAVEKLNGFLLNISLVKRNGEFDPLITTSFSFDNDHIEYAKELINGDLKSKLIKFLKDKLESSGVRHTLMFEVIHEKDPHIIGYAKNELYLIGCRENKLYSKLFLEEELDVMADDFGVNRPAWGELDELDFDGVQHEGFILRKPDGCAYSKNKSPYYKAIKMFRAIKPNKIDQMYDNSNKFKDEIPDGFEHIVDEIISTITRDSLKQMDGVKRVELIRSLIK